MPVGKKFDFQLNGKGYMLLRGQQRGRAWQRTGMPDSPGTRSVTDARHGQLPDELDHPEVWDDWSGGFGMPYRHGGENTYHWAENFDARFPRQLVHCQQVQLVPANPGYSHNYAIEDFMDMTYTNWSLDKGQGALLVLGYTNMGTILPAAAASLVWKAQDIGTDPVTCHQPALHGSYIYVGNIQGSMNFFGYSMQGGLAWYTDETWAGTGFVVVGNRLWR